VLPFNLELYRFIIVLMLAALASSLLSGKLQLTTLGRRKPIMMLITITILSWFANFPTLTREGLSGAAFKAVLAFFTSVVLFVLVASTIKTFDEVTMVVMALVIGAGIVGGAAIYESSTHYNVFDHLDKWFPILHRARAPVILLRGGRLRVRASSQHPIALGCALTMCTPLALYCARRARNRFRAGLWALCGVTAVIGSFVTLSRTVTLVLAGMTIAALWIRRDLLFKLWPLVFLLPALIHFAAPGALGTIAHSFNPYGGIQAAESQRAGQVGSGRLSDINPGLHMFAKSPVFGIGVGALHATGGGGGQSQVGVISLGAPASGSSGSSGTSAIAEQSTSEAAPAIIFDDQYMNTLVSLGFIGLVAVVWLIWGVFFDLARAARKQRASAQADERHGELLAAMAVSAGGFAVSMATLDAFAFVQATLVFFVIAALGLRVRALTREQ
jgi:hypothetical protein